MRAPFRLILPLACIVAGPACASDLALRSVMLSTAGVGYFEYAADVDGNPTLGLDIPLDQVDDVLKSLVVFDAAGGVGGIELPGRDTSRAAFGNVPFGPDALATPLDFLNSLQGVRMQVTGPQPMEGAMLRAEAVHEPSGKSSDTRAVERTRVTLLTEAGLRQFVLEEVESVQVADPDLRSRIAAAIAALRHEVGQDTRHLTIRLAGRGARVVRVGYVAAAPLWKATYRLVLPKADGAPGRLQAWAVLENASGADWNGVALTLQYGNPVTFHQALYRSYFAQRPEVPVEVLGHLLPDVDTRARSEPQQAASASPPPAPASTAAPKTMASMGAAMRTPAPAMAMAPPEAPTAMVEGAEQTEYAVASPVTLAAGHSASVPLLDRELPAGRIDLLTENKSHPLATVRLVNDTGVSLPAGVLTLYDTATASAPYAGDARLGGLPNGERRLLSFAEDLRTTAEWRRADTVTIGSLTAARGILRLEERRRTNVRVTLTAPARESRHVLIEVGKTTGVTLASEDGRRPDEETATAWRLAADLAPGEVKTVSVNLDRVTRQQIALLDDTGALTRVLGLQGLTAPARAALERVASLRAAEAAREAERDRVQAQIEPVEKDEERVRANLGAVAAGDALHARLIRQLDADETRLAALATELDRANQALAAAHKMTLEAIGGLNL